MMKGHNSVQEPQTGEIPMGGCSAAAGEGGDQIVLIVAFEELFLSLFLNQSCFPVESLACSPCIK